MEDALLETWEGQFENASDHTDDAKTLFFVELMHADFKIDLKIGEENEKIEVIRWQFPLLHGMLRTAYSAQGLTLDGGVLVDLRRAGGLEDDDWWLAIYVMLTRARKLENLILLGMTDQVEDLLRRGPPAYLRELTDKLEAKGEASMGSAQGSSSAKDAGYAERRIAELEAQNLALEEQLAGTQRPRQDDGVGETWFVGKVGGDDLPGVTMENEIYLQTKGRSRRTHALDLLPQPVPFNQDPATSASDP
eukprot:symbB.v1.2.033496.t1/scaffold4169.1/size43589/4